jgi:hypothetical protein
MVERHGTGVRASLLADFGEVRCHRRYARLAIAAGLHLPARFGWREVLVVGCMASIGLVFTLFFAGAVILLGPLLLEMKMGALMTIPGGGLAFAAARLLRVGRFAR